MKEENGFLVALSAMGSNMSVTGMSNIPTDTMMILDLSSSMYGGSKRTPDAVKTMVNSVNQTINDLQAINEHNRVGVVIYFGGPDRNQSKSTTSLVLLPLDRYSGTTTFLKTNVSSGKLEGELEVSDVTTTIIGGGTADAISFTNKYIPEPTSAVIPGNKILTGKVMNGGEFSFELYASDAAWAQGEKLETVKTSPTAPRCTTSPWPSPSARITSWLPPSPTMALRPQRR